MTRQIGAIPPLFNGVVMSKNDPARMADDIGVRRSRIFWASSARRRE